MAKKAFITGITGQDGSYLSKLLLEKGYEVIGAYRRSASINSWRLDELGVTKDIRMVPFEMLEASNMHRTLRAVKPDEVYNLAAQSFVALSFEQPIYTCEVDGMGPAKLLEAVREECPEAHFYQASTSEMFGKVQETPQNEKTPFYPRSPYGVGKLFAHWTTVNYRESFGMHTSSGLLFNHESPLRGLEFVTRKITSTLAQIKLKHAEVLELGNMDASRDWGFAGDYVEGMWRMLQQSSGADYILSTGITHTVREFVTVASRELGFDLQWEGSAEKEVGIDRNTNKTILRVNPAFYRPAEVDLLVGNSGKANAELGWKPSTDFEELVRMMARADHDRATRGPIRN